VVDPALVVDVPFDEVELHPANSRVAVVSAATAIVPIRMPPRVVTDSSLDSKLKWKPFSITIDDAQGDRTGGPADSSCELNQRAPLIATESIH
jgi:hypothetical protein